MPRSFNFRTNRIKNHFTIWINMRRFRAAALFCCCHRRVGASQLLAFGLIEKLAPNNVTKSPFSRIFFECFDIVGYFLGIVQLDQNLMEKEQYFCDNFSSGFCRVKFYNERKIARRKAFHLLTVANELQRLSTFVSMCIHGVLSFRY